VSTAAGVGKAAANVDGRGRLVTITDPAAVDRVLDVDVASGSLGDGGVAVSTGLARRSGWRLGTPVTIGFPDGTSARLSVNALFRDTDVVGSVVVPRVVWAPHAPQATDEIVLVELRNGVSLDTGTAAVERATAPYGGPDVLDRAGYADQAATGVDLFLGVVYALLALAVLIALMGIANTLSLSVHERTRELGLLRAVGETRRQVRSMVRAESVLVALFGTIGGSMLGLFLGWALVTAAGSDTAVFAVPVGRLVAVLVVGAVAGVVAGLRPARRAARLDVLEAIASP
jgi:putative ABC transport system permease protein